MHTYASAPSGQPLKPRKKRGCLSRILGGGLLLLLLLAAGGFIAKNRVENAWLPLDSASTEQIPVQIQVGSGVSQIATILEENHVIKNHTAFILYCRMHQLDQNLQAGNYRFSPSQSVPEIAEMICEGKIYLNLITIPEGFTVTQIGERLIEAGLVEESAWKEALQKDYDRSYLLSNNSIREPLEGFLFPDTYDLQEDTAPSEMIEQMLNRFDEVWQQVSDENEEKNNSPFSLHELVTIASLVERECQVESEQARIAGVIYNRLKRGMPLQIDASVLYALGEHKETVLLSDLKVDSPYNTYLYPGLPPGPIACPGEKALAAALHPEQHEYLYYVATGDGSHAFSTNFNDHLQAQRKYQQ